MERPPGPLTGAFDGLTNAERRRARAFRIMGLVFDVEQPRPIPPEFPMYDRGSAAYQLQRARSARLYGSIDAERYSKVETEARGYIDGTPIQTTVDGVRLSVDPPRLVPHEFEQKSRK